MNDAGNHCHVCGGQFVNDKAMSTFQLCRCRWMQAPPTKENSVMGIDWKARAERAESECERLRADAARYQAIRDNNAINIWQVYPNTYGPLRGEVLDAAIRAEP